ncbi:peptidoglycan/xylan/chitin deacetylase, PgdA/CDA1 family [Terrimicrobium sacchariphilum]|uniref:Peptidoglycan/xylan/chitin deacetylase, PgdA/CDA1 family n=1 Tax=Terrimicrobium sacchariphilum TaxID=690879 RepID=A0A146G9Q7_TERSA|nr:DUF2334 domain-containing protein [Terrimicrobium sacchariphilum]GAT33594.1 peptidoglycan/xylan/chitin deacetylase, PgdA/CDA1 family [Terrimicrobium sacchariphilum]
MKSPLFARCLSAAFLSLGTLGITTLCPAQADAPKITTTYVILKLDDVTNGTPQWKRTLDYLKSKNIKSSAGIICNSLESGKQAYYDWLKEVQQSGVVEFWLHGYDHKQWKEEGKDVWEFSGPSYEQQKEHIAKSQQLARQILGAPFAAFGAPFNKTDEATVKALAEDPDIKIVLYGNTKDAAALPGKLILDRTEMNIEAPLFLPNSQKVKHDYEVMAGTRDCFVIQGHPNQWTDERFAEFQKLVEYLQSQGVVFTTPTEYLKTRDPGSLKVTVVNTKAVAPQAAAPIATEPPPLSENLLANGDFESGSRGWSLYDPEKSSSAGCQFQVVADNPHEGSGTMELSSAANSRYAVLQYLKGANFIEGQKYRVSAWVRAGEDFVAASGTPGFLLRVSMFGPNFSNSGMYFLGFNGMGGDSPSVLAGQEVPRTWTKVEGVFEMAAGVEKVNVCLLVDRGVGHVYVDDVSIERVEDATPVGAVATTK